MPVTTSLGRKTTSVARLPVLRQRSASPYGAPVVAEDRPVPNKTKHSPAKARARKPISQPQHPEPADSSRPRTEGAGVPEEGEEQKELGWKTSWAVNQYERSSGKLRGVEQESKPEKKKQKAVSGTAATETTRRTASVNMGRAPGKQRTTATHRHGGSPGRALEDISHMPWHTASEYDALLVHRKHKARVEQKRREDQEQVKQRRVEKEAADREVARERDAMMEQLAAKRAVRRQQISHMARLSLSSAGTTASDSGRHYGRSYRGSTSTMGTVATTSGAAFNHQEDDEGGVGVLMLEDRKPTTADGGSRPATVGASVSSLLPPRAMTPNPLKRHPAVEEKPRPLSRTAGEAATPSQLSHMVNKTVRLTSQSASTSTAGGAGHPAERSGVRWRGSSVTGVEEDPLQSSYPATGATTRTSTGHTTGVAYIPSSALGRPPTPIGEHRPFLLTNTIDEVNFPSSPPPTAADTHRDRPRADVDHEKKKSSEARALKKSTAVAQEDDEDPFPPPPPPQRHSTNNLLTSSSGGQDESSSDTEGEDEERHDVDAAMSAGAGTVDSDEQDEEAQHAVIEEPQEEEEEVDDDDDDDDGDLPGDSEFESWLAERQCALDEQDQRILDEAATIEARLEWKRLTTKKMDIEPKQQQYQHHTQKMAGGAHCVAVQLASLRPNAIRAVVDIEAKRRTRLVTEEQEAYDSALGYWIRAFNTILAEEQQQLKQYNNLLEQEQSHRTGVNSEERMYRERLVRKRRFLTQKLLNTPGGERVLSVNGGLLSPTVGGEETSWMAATSSQGKSYRSPSATTTASSMGQSTTSVRGGGKAMMSTSISAMLKDTTSEDMTDRARTKKKNRRNILLRFKASAERFSGKVSDALLRADIHPDFASTFRQKHPFHHAQNVGGATAPHTMFFAGYPQQTVSRHSSRRGFFDRKPKKGGGSASGTGGAASSVGSFISARKLIAAQPASPGAGYGFKTRLSVTAETFLLSTETTDDYDGRHPLGCESSATTTRTTGSSTPRVSDDDDGPLPLWSPTAISEEDSEFEDAAQAEAKTESTNRHEEEGGASASHAALSHTTPPPLAQQETGVYSAEWDDGDDDDDADYEQIEVEGGELIGTGRHEPEDENPLTPPIATKKGDATKCTTSSSSGTSSSTAGARRRWTIGTTPSGPLHHGHHHELAHAQSTPDAEAAVGEQAGSMERSHSTDLSMSMTRRSRTAIIAEDPDIDAIPHGRALAAPRELDSPPPTLSDMVLKNRRGSTIETLHQAVGLPKSTATPNSPLLARSGSMRRSTFSGTQGTTLSRRESFSSTSGAAAAAARRVSITSERSSLSSESGGSFSAPPSIAKDRTPLQASLTGHPGGSDGRVKRRRSTLGSPGLPPPGQSAFSAPGPLRRSTSIRGTMKPSPSLEPAQARRLTIPELYEQKQLEGIAANRSAGANDALMGSSVNSSQALGASISQMSASLTGGHSQHQHPTFQQQRGSTTRATTSTATSTSGESAPITPLLLAKDGAKVETAPTVVESTSAPTPGETPQESQQTTPTTKRKSHHVVMFAEDETTTPEPSSFASASVHDGSSVAQKQHPSHHQHRPPSIHTAHMASYEAFGTSTTSQPRELSPTILRRKEDPSSPVWGAVLQSRQGSIATATSEDLACLLETLATLGTVTSGSSGDESDDERQKKKVGSSVRKRKPSTTAPKSQHVRVTSYRSNRAKTTQRRQSKRRGRKPADDAEDHHGLAPWLASDNDEDEEDEEEEEEEGTIDERSVETGDERPFGEEWFLSERDLYQY